MESGLLHAATVLATATPLLLARRGAGRAGVWAGVVVMTLQLAATAIGADAFVAVASAVTTLIITVTGVGVARRVAQQQAAVDAAESSAAARSALLRQAADVAARMGNMEPESAIEAVVRAVSLLGFDGGCIARYDTSTSRWSIRYPWQLPTSFTQKASWHLGGITGVLRSKVPQLVDHYPDAKEADDALVADGVTALVAVPAYEDPPFSAALLAVRRGGPSPDPDTLDALALLGAQTAAVISNARGFDRARRAAQRLRDVDRMKTDFLATVSHELRTPLAIMQAASRTLAARWEAIPDDTRAMLLEQVRDNSERLSDVVVSLLDFSDISDAEHSDAAPVRLSRLADEVADRLEEEVFAAGQLTRQIPTGVGVLGHRTLLDKALEQLLTNAAQHTPAGTPVLLRVDPGPDQVTVTIADQGPGLPEGALDGLGERFFRLSDPEHRGTSGLGLGLALVQEVLRLHGTVLRSSSGPQGTTFAFDLPAAAVEDHLPAAITTPAPPGTTRRTPGRLAPGDDVPAPPPFPPPAP